MIYKQEIHNVNNGVGFIGLLQITFIVLKLCKVINWSWLKVMLPAIISSSLSTLVILIYFIVLARNR